MVTKKLKPGVYIREVASDDSYLSLELLFGSDIYQRVRRELNSIAVANQVSSLEEFFSEDIEYLHCQGLINDDVDTDDVDTEYAFSPEAIIECLKILKDRCEAQKGKTDMSKTVGFLTDLHKQVSRIGTVGNRFRLIFEPGGFV